MLQCALIAPQAASNEALLVVPVGTGDFVCFDWTRTKLERGRVYAPPLGCVVLFYGAFSFIEDKEALWETMRFRKISTLVSGLILH